VLAQLTLREREVLELLASGRRYKEAAHELGISKRTVEEHLQRAQRKLGAETLTQAIATYARREALAGR
jgi:DNA-binding CsgD family transcriptional regulator